MDNGCYRQAVAHNGMTKRILTNSLFEYLGLRVSKILMQLKEYVFVRYVTFVNKTFSTSPAEFVRKLRAIEEKSKLFFFGGGGGDIYTEVASCIVLTNLYGISYQITLCTA